MIKCDVTVYVLLDYGIILAPFYTVSGLFVPPINVEEMSTS